MKDRNLEAVLAIFGPDGKDLVDSSDPRPPRAAIARCSRWPLPEAWRLEDDGADRKTLVIGNEAWPFPVPLVKGADGWRFDTAAGKEEVLARRIGRNELAAILDLPHLCRARSGSTRSSGHDGKPAGLYAKTFASDPGRQNGLTGRPCAASGAVRWATSWRRRRQEGRAVGGDRPAAVALPRLLLPDPDRAGTGRAGRCQDYVAGGELSRGFALVAWPAHYDATGVMTFVVNQDGVVRERDLGPAADGAGTSVPSTIQTPPGPPCPERCHGVPGVDSRACWEPRSWRSGLSLPAAWAQTAPDAASTPPAAAPAPAPTDPLGRDTPRGTVIGFLTAGKDGKSEIATQYLRTDVKGADAASLSHQLFVVLDARLPAKLAKLSDVPEGSRENPLKVNEEIVGTVERAEGPLDIVVERVEQPKGPAIWLFSADTLKAVPDLYDEVSGGWGNTGIGQLLNSTRLRRSRHFEWLAVLLCLPLFYFATVLLNKLLTPLVRGVWRRAFPESDFIRKVLPAPIRLLVAALALRWFLSSVSLSLFVRQAGATAANIILIAALAWLLVQLNGEVERYVRRRIPGLNAGAGIALVRLVRRFADIVVVVLALLATLRIFAVDPTPALAGLGVGGIAIALAAQKTLENVIAGMSLIVDQAVRVGDTLKMGDVVGTVDHIGLRSTRIRTLDRTIVSVPNSQIANVTLETLSARDKFWFHPVIGLRYETTPQQLRDIIDGISQLVAGHSSIEKKSVRVRFLRLGSYSLDVEVFAYVLARDWDHFLEIQEQLLLRRDRSRQPGRRGDGLPLPDHVHGKRRRAAGRRRPSDTGALTRRREHGLPRMETSRTCAL